MPAMGRSAEHPEQVLRWQVLKAAWKAVRCSSHIRRMQSRDAQDANPAVIAGQETAQVAIIKQNVSL